MPRDLAPLTLPSKPVDHPPVKPARIGVLLVNLGTPDGTGYWPMRRYLGQFLSDRRVVETNPLIWQPILNLVVLTTRPQKSGKLYAEIWNREKDESPLKTITRDQAEAISGLLRERHGDRIVVDWAMRYGNPSTESRLKALADQGCERVLLFPLYPQYSATTTATACDDAFRALMRMRRQPALRVVPHYHDDPAYIDAVARSIRERLDGLERQPEVVVASFHGLPKEFLLKGDPYHCYCIKTARLVRERLGWPESRLKVTFQSRFGPEEWLKPYTDETVVELAKSGVKRMAIVAPGFSADCLETLEELDVQMRDLFLGNGGEEFTYVPCLNAAGDHVRMLAGIAERELSGWV
jgi:ferrochelatase